jgi:hypothetical protein
VRELLPPALQLLKVTSSDLIILTHQVVVVVVVVVVDDDYDDSFAPIASIGRKEGTTLEGGSHTALVRPFQTPPRSPTLFPRS